MSDLRISPPPPRLAWLVCGVVVVAALSGCQSDPPRFKQNAAYKLKMERANMGGDEGSPTALSDAVTSDIGNILVALFGTPDAPKLPAVEGLELEKLADLHDLQAAAGAVASDRTGAAQGLYREHC